MGVYRWIQAEIASIVDECVEEEKKARKKLAKQNAVQKQQQQQQQAQKQKTAMQSTSTPFVPSSIQTGKAPNAYNPSNVYHPPSYNPIPVATPMVFISYLSLFVTHYLFVSHHLDSHQCLCTKETGCYSHLSTQYNTSDSAHRTSVSPRYSTNYSPNGE